MVSSYYRVILFQIHHGLKLKWDGTNQPELPVWTRINYGQDPISQSKHAKNTATVHSVNTTGQIRDIGYEKSRKNLTECEGKHNWEATQYEFCGDLAFWDAKKPASRMVPVGILMINTQNILPQPLLECNNSHVGTFRQRLKNELANGTSRHPHDKHAKHPGAVGVQQFKCGNFSAASKEWQDLLCLMNIGAIYDTQKPFSSLLRKGCTSIRSLQFPWLRFYLLSFTTPSSITWSTTVLNCGDEVLLSSEWEESTLYIQSQQQVIWITSNHNQADT